MDSLINMKTKTILFIALISGTQMSATLNVRLDKLIFTDIHQIIVSPTDSNKENNIYLFIDNQKDKDLKRIIDTLNSFMGLNVYVVLNKAPSISSMKFFDQVPNCIFLVDKDFKRSAPAILKCHRKIPLMVYVDKTNIVKAIIEQDEEHNISKVMEICRLQKK